MSFSRQAVIPGPSLMGAGKVPALTLRHNVEALNGKID